jgi:asparagine N-glycosylation enzyme membrane subunit Stt3
LNSHKQRSEQLINLSLKWLILNCLFVVIFLPFFIVVGINGENWLFRLFCFLVWSYGFYSYAKYVDSKEIVGLRISISLAVLMVIVSFLY